MKSLLSCLIVVLLFSCISTAAPFPDCFSYFNQFNKGSCLAFNDIDGSGLYPWMNEGGFRLKWNFTDPRWSYQFQEDVAGAGFDTHFSIDKNTNTFTLLVAFEKTYWDNKGLITTGPGTKDLWPCTTEPNTCLYLDTSVTPGLPHDTLFAITGNAPDPWKMGFEAANFSGTLKLFHDFGGPQYCDWVTPVCPFYLGGWGTAEVQWHWTTVEGEQQPYVDYFAMYFENLHERTTPEPTSLLLVGTGVLSLAGVIRRKLRT